MSALDRGGDSRATSRRSAAAQFALLAVLFTLGLWRSWGKWPDVMVDFGRELYTPWRLAEGDVLFRDIAWFNGPLSPYWNALAFKLFGVGLSTLVWVNAALFAVVLALLHAVVRAFSSPWAATAACAVVLACCGFAQLVGIGNYNYICPYSHEATHGVLLTLAALHTANRWSANGKLHWAVLCGLWAGLAFLTKPEMFVAALVGGLGGLAFHAWVARTPLRRQFATLGALAAGLAAPLVIAFALLSSSLTTDEAQRGVLGAWPSLFSGEVAELAFYRAGMGLDRPGENLIEIAAWAGRWGALLTLLAALSWFARRAAPKPSLMALAALALGAATYGLFQLARLSDAARPWQLFAALALLGAVFAVLRRSADRAGAQRAAFALAALALLAKMALNVRIPHYGFALAMPATALLAASIVDALPRWLASRGASAALARAGALGVLGVFAGLHVAASERIFALKQESIGAGADEFVADARAKAFKAALGWIAKASESSVAAPTLAVFPEGVMLNYLARLENPTPFQNFMPPEIVLFGERRILRAFEAAPPDFVIITHKNTAEYGYPFFGVDYARDLGAWLRREYQAVQVFGDPPLQPQSRFGVAVLTRRR
jgi:hypothetical protein